MDAEAGAPCLARLKSTLAALTDVDSAELRAIDAICRPLRAGTSDHLVKAGDVAEQVFFICRGLVRFYYLTVDGKEHNKSFATEGQFAGSILSSTRREPSRFFIQALEPVAALAISTDALEHLYVQSAVWANIGRKYMEGVAIRKERREGEFLLDSAEERYRRLLTEQPQLAERLPLYHLASYLGVTDVALSRIRRRLKASGVLNPG